jgi:hypothetical protein
VSLLIFLCDWVSVRYGQNVWDLAISERVAECASRHWIGCKNPIMETLLKRGPLKSAVDFLGINFQ